MKYWLLAAENKTSAYEMTRGSSQSAGGWDSSLSTVTRLEVEEGDAVLLWRKGRGGGVVALGEIAITTPVESDTLDWSLARLIERGDEGSTPPHVRVRLSFGKLSFAAPVSTPVLRTSGLDHVVKRARSATTGRQLVALNLAARRWRDLIQLLEEIQAPDDMPTAWSSPPGAVVKRSELHDVYGGSPRLTVGASGRTPNAFLFLDRSVTGQLAPRWDGPVLLASGQSQWTDTISDDNLAALAHRRRGVPLRVFVAHRSESLYLGEFAIEPESPVERWVDTGKRDITPSYAHRPHIVDTRAPLFRLRQLNGVSMPTDEVDPFRNASRISLRLQPVGNQPAATAIRKLLTVLESEPATATSLVELDEAQLLATLVQRARRQADLDELRVAVEDPESSEGDLQRLVERMTWIFGGEFLPGTVRRNITLRDQLDLALLRPDGTLHGVELKKANIKRLVTGQRNHLIVGTEVNKAVGQAMNYLRELDEKRPQILVDLGIDCRRASMTVVIGHSGFVTTDASPQEIDETIRTFNSYLTRLSVTTYGRLIENAQRTINLTASGR
ncbi:Shedu anti-phage system protein SduA domain-containing protein [Streptomyces sp. NPDC102274]|uniref:Shedu anti-phage system protein SduA domain-containing protein n=1 Tax=Streptomyces sp. NPDC102274 TaxID=3366151 RepID=UPI003815AD26